MKNFTPKFSAIKGIIKEFEDMIEFDDKITEERVSEIYEETLGFLRKIVEIK